MSAIANSPPLGDALFRYILAEAFYSPEPEERDLWQPLLDDFLAECRAPEQTAALEEWIDSEKGTILEPFRLSKEDRACVLYLLRVAFSARYARTRFRVVSRDNLSDQGGLVFTSNFRAYFETRAWKDPYAYRSMAWRMVPRSVRVPSSEEKLFLTGDIVPDDAGFAIRVRRRDLRNEPSSRNRSKIVDHYDITLLNSTDDSSSDLELEAEEKGPYLKLRPPGPEAMIRWLGRIQGGTRLRFRRQLKGAFRFHEFHLVLTPPADQPIPLALCGFPQPEDTHWFNGSVSPSRELFGRYRQLVVDRFFIPQKTAEFFFSSSSAPLSATAIA